MLRVLCDTCHETIDLNTVGWFGIDHAHVDDNGDPVPVEEYHRFHFDTADCAIAWLMEHSYRPQRSEGAT